MLFVCIYMHKKLAVTIALARQRSPAYFPQILYCIVYIYFLNKHGEIVKILQDR